MIRCRQHAAIVFRNQPAPARLHPGSRLAPGTGLCRPTISSRRIASRAWACFDSQVTAQDPKPDRQAASRAARQAREAAALRENLRRRKAQARAREEGTEPAPAPGAPASETR